MVAVLTLLLIPVTLTDSRRWHWEVAPLGSRRYGSKVSAIIANSALLVIRVQVALIYIIACTAKLGVTEWRNGTAVYYWFLHPVFGLPGYLRSYFVPFLENRVVVTLMTWSVFSLEAVLFAGLFMHKDGRRILLRIGIIFHFMIVIALGLFSFFLAMWAALILFLRRPNEVFELGRIPQWWKLRSVPKKGQGASGVTNLAES